MSHAYTKRQKIMTVDDLSEEKKEKILLYKKYKEQYLDKLYDLHGKLYEDMMKDGYSFKEKNFNPSRNLQGMNDLEGSLLEMMDILYDELVGRRTPLTITDYYKI